MRNTTMAVRVYCCIFAAALLTTAAQAADPSVTTSYTAYRFAKTDNWHRRDSGNAGATQWKAPAWSLDFSQGAAWVGIGPPDMSLLGKVTKIAASPRDSERASGSPVPPNAFHDVPQGDR